MILYFLALFCILDPIFLRDINKQITEHYSSPTSMIIVLNSGPSAFDLKDVNITNEKLRKLFESMINKYRNGLTDNGLLMIEQLGADLKDKYNEFFSSVKYDMSNQVLVETECYDSAVMSSQALLYNLFPPKKGQNLTNGFKDYAIPGGYSVIDFFAGHCNSTRLLNKEIDRLGYSKNYSLNSSCMRTLNFAQKIFGDDNHELAMYRINEALSSLTYEYDGKTIIDALNMTHIGNLTDLMNNLLSCQLSSISLATQAKIAHTFVSLSSSLSSSLCSSPPRLSLKTLSPLSYFLLLSALPNQGQIASLGPSAFSASSSLIFLPCELSSGPSQLLNGVHSELGPLYLDSLYSTIQLKGWDTLLLRVAVDEAPAPLGTRLQAALALWGVATALAAFNATAAACRQIRKGSAAKRIESFAVLEL